MKEVYTSHFTNLQDIIYQSSAVSTQGIPISTVPLIMDRNDSLSIFQEGDAFSRNYVGTEAEVSLSLCSSPHYKPSIPIDDFTKLVTNVTGLPTEIPLSRIKTKELPPHLLIWWRTHDIAAIGLAQIFTLPPPVRDDLLKGISSQTTKALNVMATFPGNKVVYGTWGYATPQERANNGLSRGGPTNPNGHCHVAVINTEVQDISVTSQLSPIQRLKYLSPWNKLINSQLQQPITHLLYKALLPYGSETTVRFRRSTAPTGYSQEYYEINYSKPTSFEQALLQLTDLASQIEILYGHLQDNFAKLHLSASGYTKYAQVRSDAVDQLQTFGFTQEDANSLIQFIEKIRPTFGQIHNWSIPTKNLPQHLAETLHKREKVLRRIGNAQRFPFILDTYKEPSDTTIVHTWPVHSSIAYLFENIFIDQGQAYVTGFSLIPSIISTSGAPEKILGVELVRQTT